MYLLIPLILILASAVGIFFIVWKKMPYLKKLTVTDIPSDSSIWADLFPEFSSGLKGPRLKNYREMWLIELEKILRRFRVMSMKMDRASDSLIKKIRNVTEKSKEPVQIVEKEKETTSPKAEEQIRPTADEIKKEEQRLIIEIAKNPKNSSLYETLGDLYMKMSNFSDAKESYEAAIELNPEKEELKNKHSQALENLVK